MKLGDNLPFPIGWYAEHEDGEPCSHRGCLRHISHPCEGCGRIGGITLYMWQVEFWNNIGQRGVVGVKARTGAEAEKKVARDVPDCEIIGSQCLGRFYEKGNK